MSSFDVTINSENNINSHLLLSQYKEIVDRSAIISKTNPKGIITYVNDKFCQISGYTQKELLGSAHNIVRHPETESTKFELMWHTISKEKKPWSGALKNLKKDGSSYWVNATINPILDENNNIIEFIALRTEITEQEELKQYFQQQYLTTTKQFNEAVNLSKQYQNAINDSNIVSMTDEKGKIVFVNDKFSNISKYTKEELIGKKQIDLIHPDISQEQISELIQTTKKGHTYQSMIKYLNKNNEPYWVDCTVVPMKINGKIVKYMFISHDITEIIELHKEVRSSQNEIIYKMGEICETRSKETGNHVKRVAHYSKQLALLYGISLEEANILFAASPMHDIGKVGIPDTILHKPSKLTEEEYKKMQQHCEIGRNILKGSDRDVLKAASIIAYEHHEKWDGSGYPQGLKQEDIHIYGRITAIADVFDAVGSNRCYKKAWKDEKIFQLFKEESGKHFDPTLVNIFLENKENFLAIRSKYKDS